MDFTDLKFVFRPCEVGLFASSLYWGELTLTLKNSAKVLQRITFPIRRGSTLHGYQLGII